MLTLKGLIEERKKLIKNRKAFWKNNEKNFEKNAYEVFSHLLKKLNISKKWKVDLALMSYLPKKEMMPYDYSAFNSTELLAASECQGFEILLLLNKSRLGFLSKSAMAPTIAHELVHVQQASKNPGLFLASITRDKLSRELETEADIKALKILEEDEFRKQEVLELVLYCYDKAGWNSALKMANYWHKDICSMYGGGYLPAMTFQEYSAFLEAMKKKDINLFISFFE